MSSFERWRTHLDTCSEQLIFDTTLRLYQDPSSYNLGTTVWDASVVLSKYIERESHHRSDFSKRRLSGKRVLELGAGAGGLVGITLAFLGCEVTATDLQSVLPLLIKNTTTNLLSPPFPEEVGTISVRELDWQNEATYSNFSPPYDHIVAADCVYNESAVNHFLQVVVSMANHRSIITIANEFRSQTVHDEFMLQFSSKFTIRKIPLHKMDDTYRHPLIHIYQLKLKRG